MEEGRGSWVFRKEREGGGGGEFSQEMENDSQDIYLKEINLGND